MERSTLQKQRIYALKKGTRLRKQKANGVRQNRWIFIIIHGFTYKLSGWSRDLPWFFPLVIYGVAVAFRLLFVWESNQLAEYRVLSPGMDPDVYWRAAQLMAHGIPNIPNLELAATTSPFFVLWLYAVQAITGSSLLAYRIIMAALTALNPVLLYSLTLKGTGRRNLAGIAALCLAVAPNALHFDTIVAKTNLEIIFYLLAAHLVLSLCTPHELSTRLLQTLKCIGLGLILALLLLLQRVGIFFSFFVVLILLSAASADWPRRLLYTVVVLLAFASTFFLANGAMNAKFDVRPTAGFNLYLSSHAGASGVYSPITGVGNNLFGHAFDSKLNAEMILNRKLTPQESDEVYKTLFISYVRTNPGDALKLFGRKIWLFFNSFENKCEEYFPLLKIELIMIRWNPIRYGFLSLFAPFGVMYLWRRSSLDLCKIMLAIYCSTFLGCVILMPLWRYRYPAFIVMSVFGAGGLLYVFEQGKLIWQRQEWKKLSVGLSVIAAAMLMIYGPVHSQEYLKKTMALSLVNFENALSKEEKMTRIKSLAIAPDGSEDHKNRLNLVCGISWYSQCFAELSTYILHDLTDADVDRKYGRYLILLGRYDAARAFYLRVKAENLSLFQRLIVGDDGERQTYVLRHLVLLPQDLI